MAQPQDNLDSHISSYVQEKPTLTYVQPSDPWLVQKFISSVEILFGRRKIEALYDQLKEPPFTVESFFSTALKTTGIETHYDANKLAALPKSGPLVFVANHPFGVVDGLALCDMAIKARGNFRILINAMLCQDKDLAPYFLPIDFKETKSAIKNNIRTKKMALECLKEDIPLLIFPSGYVSTADRNGLGKAVDAPWTTFAAKLIRDAQGQCCADLLSTDRIVVFFISRLMSQSLCAWRYCSTKHVISSASPFTLRLATLLSGMT